MSQTANFKLPKPGLTDQPNGPVQIGALADSVDALLAGWFRPRMKQVQRTGTGQTIPDSADANLVGYNATPITIGPSIDYTGGVYTVDFTGAVDVAVTVVYPVASTGFRSRMRIYANGTQVLGGIDTKWIFLGVPGQQTAHTHRTTFAVSPGDQINASVWQDSGASITLASDVTVFTIRRVG